MQDTIKYQPLKMPSGKFNSRQKALWEEITSQIPPGVVVAGNETMLIGRLVKSQWRAEVLEHELEEVLEEAQTSLVLGGNNQAAVNPLFTSLERTVSTISNLSQKLKLCPSARLESKAAVTGNLTAPGTIREPADLLFAGAAEPTDEEIARWEGQGKSWRCFRSKNSLLAGMN